MRQRRRWLTRAVSSALHIKIVVSKQMVNGGILELTVLKVDGYTTTHYCALIISSFISFNDCLRNPYNTNYILKIYQHSFLI